MNEATRHFISGHLNDDVYSLKLQETKFPEVDMALAIRQILGKQKVKHKIPAFFECDELLFPQKLSLEQASSEITAKHKTAGCEGKVLIDMTGGFGVDSYFFSFNFEKVIYVERQTELCELASHNFGALNRKNIQVINNSAENQLEKTDYADWIYLDPARRTGAGKKAVLLSDCEPDVSLLAGQLLAKSNQVMIKLSPMIDISGLINELPSISEIQIIAVENECKEVVTVLRSQKADKIRVKTVNYTTRNKTETFDFQLDDEQSAQVSFTSQLQNYLYEPNSAVMKSGAFKLISERFRINKLHVNSHLYTSDTFIPDFPGRIFLIERIYDFSKNELKQFQTDIRSANLSIRNLPMTVENLRKKLKISEGGDIYVFGTTLNDGKKVLLSCRKAK